MKDWKKYLLILVVGIVIGAIPTFFITRAIYNILCPPCEKEIKDHVTTTTVSGKPGTIKHSNWKYKGTAVCFDTRSTGIGKIKTNIDKSLIPEARKWMSYNCGVQVSYSGLIYNDGIYRHIFGADFLYRWNWIAVGGGPRVSYYESKPLGKIYGGGFNVLVQAWFKGI